MRAYVRCDKCKDEKSPEYQWYSPAMQAAYARDVGFRLPPDWIEVFGVTLCKYCGNEAREVVRKLVGADK